MKNWFEIFMKSTFFVAKIGKILLYAEILSLNLWIYMALEIGNEPSTSHGVSFQKVGLIVNLKKAWCNSFFTDNFWIYSDQWFELISFQTQPKQILLNLKLREEARSLFLQKRSQTWLTNDDLKVFFRETGMIFFRF